MVEYVMTLIVTAAVCSLSLILAPEGERGAGGYVRLVASLCVLSVAISPVSSFIVALKDSEMGDLSSYVSQSKEELCGIYEEVIVGANERDVSASLEALVCRELGIREEDIEVFAELSFDKEEYYVCGASIALSGRAVAKDPREIKDYVKNLLSCECEIVYT